MTARKLADPGDRGYYPIAEGERIPAGVGTRTTVRAMPTGEFRPPRAGDWFLSGAKVEAYLATTNAMSQSYHIAILVPGTVVTTWRPNRG